MPKIAINISNMLKEELIENVFDRIFIIVASVY